MANKLHLAAALKGTKAIAELIEKTPKIKLDLSGANLRRVNLVQANLNGANLKNANLEWADLRWIDLNGANLSGSNLTRADLHKADLRGADLSHAILTMTNLEDSDLSNAILNDAKLGFTRLINTSLKNVKGLDNVEHQTASLVDKETLLKSGTIPRAFSKNMASNSNAEAIRIGYEFEREVAAIYRALGNMVEVDVGLAGNQIDVLLTQKSKTGNEIKTAIECKSTKQPVGINAVNQFATISILLKKSEIIHKSTLVSKSGFTKPAREAAKVYKIDLLEFADLEQWVKGKQSVVFENKIEIDYQQSTRECDKSKRIFVLMPFKKEFDDVYHYGIREAASSLGYIVERADDIEHNQNILEIILARIRAAHIVIGDTTGSNPNVFYEVGYSHAMNRQTILIARNGSKLPFDLRNINHIFYDTIFELSDRLRKRLTSIFPSDLQ